MNENEMVLQEGLIQVKDKWFEPYLSVEEIQSAVKRLATEIQSDFAGLNPIFLPILNGSFIFAADLLRACAIRSELTFIKARSYEALQSSGSLTELIGLEIDIQDRHVIILEDIVDTGNTLSHLMQLFKAQNPKSLTIVTLLFKPNAFEHDYPVKYVGFEIPNDFVIGYGLDYDGCGRELDCIFQLARADGEDDRSHPGEDD